MEKGLVLKKCWAGSYGEVKDLEEIGDRDVYFHTLRNEHGDTYPYLVELYLDGEVVRDYFEVVRPSHFVIYVLLFDSVDDLNNYVRGKNAVEGRKLSGEDISLHFPADIGQRKLRVETLRKINSQFKKGKL